MIEGNPYKVEVMIFDFDHIDFFMLINQLSVLKIEVTLSRSFGILEGFIWANWSWLPKI